MSAPPTGTVTFLFTGIECNTCRWEQYTAAMRITLARHDAILPTRTNQHGGRVIKAMVMAFCAAFSTAPAALLAALAA